MKKDRLSLHCLAIMLLAVAPVVAQEQPDLSSNGQDELVNLDRTVDSSVDSFKILRSGNKQEINRYVTKVYPLLHANPYELLPYLRTIAALEKGSVNTVWIPREDGTNRAFIQVNVPDFQIPSLDAAVAAYDIQDFMSAPGFIVYSYRTRYRSAAEVADFIRTSTLSPDGLIRSDAVTNTLYIQDSPSDFRRVIGQIEFYDIPAPQLSLEVSIIELTEVDQTSLGLDWDAWKTALSGAATVASASSQIDPPAGSNLNSTSRSFDGLLSVDATAAARFLNYLVDQGKANVRVRTNLTVTNGTVSTVASGTDVPNFTYAFNKDHGKSILTKAPALGAGGEGFSLALVPTIAMNAARLDVALALRSPVAIDKTGAPIYSEQDVQAQLTLEQDQLYKLGGIRRGVEAIQRKGFPLLKEIPVLKYLFSNETRIVRETELYVFLKPTWTTPQLPAATAMQGDKPTTARVLADILRANPNLSIGPEDAALLDRYFRDSQ